MNLTMTMDSRNNLGNLYMTKNFWSSWISMLSISSFLITSNSRLHRQYCLRSFVNTLAVCFLISFCAHIIFQFGRWISNATVFMSYEVWIFSFIKDAHAYSNADKCHSEFKLFIASTLKTSSSFHMISILRVRN